MRDGPGTSPDLESSWDAVAVAVAVTWKSPGHITLTVLVLGPESVSHERSRRETAAKSNHFSARVFFEKITKYYFRRRNETMVVIIIIILKKRLIESTIQTSFSSSWTSYQVGLQGSWRVS